MDMSPIIVRIFSVFFITGIPSICYAHEYGYDPLDEMGPHKWGEHFKGCAGKYQSPIDIDETYVTRVRHHPLKFSGIHQLPWTASLQNNGHTVLLRVNSSDPIRVSGGPLKGMYVFEQLHFHWGAEDSSGSEDFINNHSFPMELHLVFFNSKYGTFAKALEYRDGLTVLATFFELTTVDNRAYSELVDALPKITMPNSVTILPYFLPLEFLLPTDIERYFHYNGSLTTPPCLEVVSWIEFKHPALLSERQLHEFRRLHAFNGAPLIQNTRPIQPLHGRQVYYNYESIKSAASNVKSSFIVINFILLLLYGCLKFFF